MTRFPRYNHAGKLLQTRCGRCGEWAQAFTLLSRALGFDARFVTDWTDHVWTEVYSERLGRWMHCDPCEDAMDAPLMYEAGWGKRLTYCVAVSAHEIVDVTARYTAKWADVLARRTLLPEDALAQVLAHLSGAVLAAPPSPVVARALRSRAFAETLELAARRTGAVAPDPLRPAEAAGRQSGAEAWRAARGELGACRSDTDDASAVPAVATVSAPQTPIPSGADAQQAMAAALLAAMMALSTQRNP
jgi:peptide-N4-(N-acetyl-beta-glucosaminyl)asparagine amidase